MRTVVWVGADPAFAPDRAERYATHTSTSSWARRRDAGLGEGRSRIADSSLPAAYAAAVADVS